MVVDVVMALLPFLDISAWTDGEIICHTLPSEFGSIIVYCITHDLRSARESKSDQGKARRSALKQESVAAARVVHLEREQAWPSIVPRDVVLRCLGDYHRGSQWSEPPTWAVCSRFVEGCLVVDLSDDLVCYNLDILQISDPFIIQNCIVQSMSASFSFQNDEIDGLMLDKSGVQFVGSTGKAGGLNMCPDCRSSLSKRKIPQLALANDLYRVSWILTRAVRGSDEG